MKVNRWLIISLILVFVFCISIVRAATYVVKVDGSGDFPTIQAAIDTAINGDRIIVYPGTYYEKISIRDKDIILTSTYPDDPNAITNTVISGENIDEAPLVRFELGTPACVLNGFTITKGGNDQHSSYDYESLYYYGPPPAGGISGLPWGTHGTIKNCVISYNKGDYAGGGISYCDGLISNCVIHNNQAKETTVWMNEMESVRWPGAGGGIYNCDGIIQNCTIVNNSAEGSDKGDDIAFCNKTIVNCIYDDILFSSAPMYSCSDPNHFMFADPNNGDFHLKSQMGRWNPLCQQWVYDEVTSPCIDAGDPNDVDWQNELWPHGGRINMGACGGTAEASMSPDPVGNTADLNHDGRVDQKDFRLWADDWLIKKILMDADLDRDNDADLSDLEILVQNWLWPNL